ncbi:MAG: M23 family metallopeptidase [Gammaproteobacteria bacterium]|nr:M23 family metallopeptidase [Gammaproteobacteria bacterium]MDX2461946.1 M23 family metallopeptidase [Gammaproteobacteria bacterium]
MIALCGVTYYLGYRSVPIAADLGPELYAAAWQSEVVQQREKVESAIGDAEQNLDALALRMGEIQSRVVRLDALGRRLVEMANLDAAEFSFDDVPARGGPDRITEREPFEVPDFLASLEELVSILADREPKLAVVEGTLMNRKLHAEVFPTGRPVNKGWMSSVFGWRNDPMTGKRAFHEGIDFAGRANSEVMAVAAGVVVWSGSRWGFGNAVEVNHGNGYSTLYAHNKKNLVKVGETVKKGQVLARLGSTGRSNGPHVHFEVRLNGKAVNPIKFVRATR